MLHLNLIHTVKEWCRSHGRNLFMLAGFLMVGGLSFESGLLKGKTSQSDPIVLSIPIIAPAQEERTEKVLSVSEEQKEGARLISEQKDTAKCPLVGSRNSNKYHALTCAVVKRIKPENRVCFASKEDAEKRGYVVGCLK